MKNKKYLFISIFITSLLFIIFSYKDMMIYYYVKMGNKNYYSKNYDKAREYYEKALNIKDDYGIRINLIINDYEAKEYKKVLENPVNAGFIKGNSIVKLSENNNSNEPKEEKQEETLEKSLEYYKSAMIENSDMNIKKNYEIVLKKLENNQQNQNNQDKNQDKQDKKDNQNKNDQQKDNNKKDNQQQNNQDKNNQNNNEQNQENNKDNQNQNNNQDNQQNQNNKDKQNNQDNNQQQDKNQNNDNQQNNQENQNSQDNQNENQNQNQQQSQSNSQPQSPKDIEKARDKKELEMALKKLEGNEKQSFKNNERLIGVGKNDTKNRW